MNLPGMARMLAALVVGLLLGILIGGGAEDGSSSTGAGLSPSDLTVPIAVNSTVAPPAQASAISRTILRTVDDPAGPTHEVHMGLVEIPAGVTSGMHVHPGIEVGYVLDGTMRFLHHSREPEILSPGQSFFNDGPHEAISVGEGPLKILAVWIVAKGEPMASPVP